MNINKMKYLIHLIKSENTGTPNVLAQKIEVSERMLYNYLKILKEEALAPIKYNAAKQTYFFEEQGDLKWEWINDQTQDENKEN